jgi:hypothetical protein
MPRRHHYYRARRHHYRRNPGPVILGQDTGDLAAIAGGLILADVGNNALKGPTSRFQPPGKVMGTLFDAARTGLAGGMIGWGIGRFNRHIGNKVTTGGAVLAMGRAGGAFIPGLGITTSAPSWIPNLGAGAAGGGGLPKPASASLPSPAAPVALGTIGARSAGF